MSSSAPLFTPFQALRLGFTWHSGLEADSFPRGCSGGSTTWGSAIDQTEESTQAQVVIPEQYSLGALVRPAALAGPQRRIFAPGLAKGHHRRIILAPARCCRSRRKGIGPGRSSNPTICASGLEARLPFRSWQLSLRGGWSLDASSTPTAAAKPSASRATAAGLGCDFSATCCWRSPTSGRSPTGPERGFFFQGPDVGTHYRANAFFLALTYRFGHIFKE